MLLNPEQWWGSGYKRTAFMAFMMMIFFFIFLSLPLPQKNLYIVGRGITLGSLTNKLCTKEEKKNEKRTKKT